MNYDKLIEIQKYTDTKQDNASFSQTWQTIATSYAAIMPLSGKELSGQASYETIFTNRIYLRTPATQILPQYRVKWTDGRYGTTRYYNIVHIRDVDEKYRLMELLCEERSYEQ